MYISLIIDILSELKILLKKC